ncbi:MAG: ABC transporter substrate-binding protein [Candidatus Pacebacteria bacterium]|nr:ABC transporter substrate-binding protein [Candidatus Paceibacterota bacterium]
MEEIAKFINRLKGFFNFQNWLLFFKEFPSLGKWRHFLSVLNKKEKIVFLSLVGVLIASSAVINLQFYFSHTVKVPTAGGIYKEGLIGQPRLINPLYLSTQDIDRDIVELIFSGLMKYNKNGELVADLIQDYEIKDDGLTYDVFLKKNLFWHDKKPLTVEDILFTINLVQDPEYQSPLRIKWSGIGVEKIAGDGIRFKLPQKYSGFLESLTIKILPKHIFENISPQNMPWTLLAPKYLVGSGPFAFQKMSQDKSGYINQITLKRNERYYGQKPHIQEITLIFYENEDKMLQKASSGEIQGFSLTDPQYFKKGHYDFKSYALMMPRYFALFFNLKNQNIFATDKRLREVLALTVDKDKILQEVFLGRGEKVSSPILPVFFGFEQPTINYDYDLIKAKQLLDQIGYVVNPITQKREKATSKTVTPLFQHDLKLKDEGEEVKELQRCLTQIGLYNGPIDGIFGDKEKTAVINLQEKYADEILKPENLKKGNGLVKERTRTKLNQLCQVVPKEMIPLTINLVTSDKFPLAQAADILKKGWEDLGLTVNLYKVSLSDLQTDVLAKSNFDLLLFGEALGSLPDPFPFWHSSQKDYPGLNISGYTSREADRLLEKARGSQTAQELKESLEKFQDVLATDLPAIFLVRPDYVYFLSPNLQGFDTAKITEPAKRFSNIEEWFIKTKRVWQ